MSSFWAKVRNQEEFNETDIDCGDVKGTFQKVDHTNEQVILPVPKRWLGVLLLSDISFKSTYPTVYQLPVERAGLSPLNTSVSTTPVFQSKIDFFILVVFPSLLTDAQIAKSVAPLNCSGTGCSVLLFAWFD